MDKNMLKELVKPYQDNQIHPYYRPFVSKGAQKKYNAFLVGINPATPIYSHDIELDEYVDLLTDYGEFYKKYRSIRGNANKKEISRTRMGIVNFVDEFERHTGEEVLETNVVPYPTRNIKELKKVDPGAITHGLNLFHSVLIHHSPEILIVYSKASLKYLIKVLIENEFIETLPSINQRVRDMEHSNGAFLEFKYKNGLKGAIFVCRHFMYYGKEGQSFSYFKDKVVDYSKESQKVE